MRFSVPSLMAYKSFDYTASGRVQGVNYRNFAKQAARDLGVVGWVKNDTEENVVGVAQGEEEALSQFKKQLSQGPPYAVVKQLALSNERGIETLEFHNFDIIRP